MLLCFLVLSVVFSVAHAEDFGTSRWKTKPIPPQPSQQVLPYVVRIIAFDSTGQSFGTGSYVGTYGEYGIILTNWHVIFTEGTEGLVHVHFPSGFSTFGAIIRSDQTWDLALIAISKPPQSIPMLSISQTPSKPGDPLWIVGYGSGTYRIAEGKCVRYLAPEKSMNGTDPLYEIMEVSVSARKGDSGGPMLNQKGELAGVLFGSDMIQNTAGSYCERVNRFLMESQSDMSRLPNRPETHFASKEKEGPLHSLKESRNIVLRDVPFQRSGISSSSAASAFDTQTSSQRYIPLEHPVPNKKQSAPKNEPQKKQQETVFPGAPLSSRYSMQGIQTAVWAETSPKVGASVQPSQVIQTAHLVPLETLKPIGVIPETPPSDSPDELHHLFRQWYDRLWADYKDVIFTTIMLLNVLAAIILTRFCSAVMNKMAVSPKM